MSEYTEQAEKFLKETKTTIKIKYLSNDYYFDGETESRDIYRITLTRKGKRFTFKFGQSLIGSELGEEPTAYSVLTCLTNMNPDTFENFCAEYGYDTDSRKAEKTYKAVKKEWAGVKRLFSDVIASLQEIQ